MKYPIVTLVEKYDPPMVVAENTDVIGTCYDEGPYWYIDPGTYALVAIPENERMAVVVTEGGEWPDRFVAEFSPWLDPHSEGGGAVRSVLDALAGKDTP